MADELKFRFNNRQIGPDAKSNNFKKPRIFKSKVKTMQDDLVDLLTNKNRSQSNLMKNMASAPSLISRLKKNDKKETKVEAIKEQEKIQRNLVDVYTDGNGEIPDLTKLDKFQRPLWKTIIYVLIAVFTVILIVSLAGFWIFSNWNSDKFTNEKITLKIETPITVVSGQEETYTIILTNKEKVNLYDLQLELFYPDNFEHASASPEATGEQKNIWNFTVLKVGETQKIELTAKIIAALNSVQTLRGTLTFKPANFNANFKQEAIVDVVVAASVLDLELSGPEKILANQETEYTVKYKNLSEKDNFSDLQLIVDYPEGFVFGSAEPKSEAGNNNLWQIKELLAKGEGEIKIKGSYSAVISGGNQSLRIRIQLNYKGDYYPQSEGEIITNVIKDQLNLQLIVNGSGEDQPVNFGDILIYSLNYKNDGQDDLKDIELSATLDSPILDWTTLKDDYNGLVKQNKITWTGRHISELLKLKPGEEGVLSWQIRISDVSVVKNKDISKFSVESYAEGKVQPSGEISGESLIKSKTIVNSISSDLTLNVVARYYNEDNLPLGLGPIQPKVGETSTFNIKLMLANNLHDIKDIQIAVSLPKNVSWANKETHYAGDLIYNANSNKVTWNIARLSKSINGSEATFNVSITPTGDDLGRILILVLETNLTAQDAETGATLSKNIKAITTAFSDPILGRVSGIVE